jgi:hypothetical protein
MRKVSLLPWILVPLLVLTALTPLSTNASAAELEFPSVLNRTASINAATTSHSVSIPGPLGNIGNLLIIAISTDGTPASLVVPNGWGEIVNTTNTDRTTVYVRISDGTETNPITITSTASIASAYHAWRITRTSGNIFIVPGASGSSTAPDPPVNNIGGPALPYLWLAIVTTNGASCNANPADYTNGAASVGSGVVECRAERKLETSSENPSPFGLTGSSGWLALTLAIDPEEQPTEDLTFIWILIIAILILIGLGLWVEGIGGMLLILAGIATIVLGLQVFALFAEVLIAAMVGALGIFLIILGIMDVMSS